MPSVPCGDGSGADGAAARPADVRELAARLGVRPSKRLGQNFVIEPGTVRKIAALAALRPDDVVLEVGPGLGSLTLALLEAGAGRVVAVEIDRALAAELPRTLAARAPELAGRVTVVTADALHIAGADLPACRRCWWRTCPTTWRCRWCCTCWPSCRRWPAGWSWCRPRWRTGCARRPGHGCTARRR